MPKRIPRHRLSPTSRDLRILEHVARYRLTTLAVLRRVLLPKLSRNAVNKIASRLCACGFLGKYTLLHPVRYYVLGETGARLLGVGTHRVMPLGPQSLPLEYAVLAFATLGRKPHPRLITEELRERFPWMPESLTAAPHCMDEADVLELLRVDLGGPADHVARKCAADISERRRLAEFTALVAAGGFRLVVITATSEKAAAIRTALDRHDWPHGLQIHFSVVSHLLSLTASRNDA